MPGDHVRPRHRPAVRLIAAAVLGIGLLAYGGLGLVQAHDGVRTEQVLLDDGTPLTLHAPADAAPGSLRPALVVHGYTASATLMGMLADSIARAGFLVAVPDLVGHGRNRVPAGDVDERLTQIDDQLLQSSRALAADPRIASGSSLVLLGHSLGAMAVLRAADAPLALPVESVIAISAPALTDDQPAAVPTLFLVGAWEPVAFRDAAQEGERRLTSAGVRTQAVLIPQVEHVGVVLAPGTSRAVLQWLGAPQTALTAVRTPALPLALAMLGLVLLAAPVTRIALGRAVRQARSPRVPTSLAMVLVAVGIGAAAARLTSPWHDIHPLEVGGWLTSFFFAAGVALMLLRSLWRLRLRSGDGQPRDPSGLRTTIGALAITALLITALALSGQQSWNAFDLAGDRRWALPVMEVALITFFMAEELVVRRGSRVFRGGLRIASRVLVLVGIGIAVTFLDAPRILLLQLPLIGILMAITGWWGHAAGRHSPEPWVIATVQAVPIAYVVASTLPLS